MSVACKRDHVGSFHDWVERRLVALPSVQEALTTPISDDLVFFWSVHAEQNAPSDDVRHYAWDIVRMVGADRAYEMLRPVAAQWSDIDDVRALIASCNRPQGADDVLLLHELAILHSRGEFVGLPELWGEAHEPDEVAALAALKVEVAALAKRFDELRCDAIKEAATPYLKTQYIGSQIRDGFALIERERQIPDSNVIELFPDTEAAATENTEGVTFDDFVAYLPSHGYIFKPTREMWPASSVNARLPPLTVPGRDKPLAPSAWLDLNRPVEQMTWAPGQSVEINDRLIADGGWIDRPGVTVFNQYRPPVVQRIAGDATPWVAHVRYVYGDDADHIIRWLAHRVQRPHEKLNHALLLGGSQGVGKDTLLEPVKHAVGSWNFADVSPQQLLGRFNGFGKSVVLRVSEARDLGEADRFAFYDHLKTYTAAPPDVLRIDEKHLREHYVMNVCGVIITTNHKSDGVFLPADDRRHFVAWSPRTKDDFAPAYWNELWRWYGCGGVDKVAHYLATLDLSGFDPKAPPPKTRAFWDIVNSSRAVEDAEMADALDQLGRPAVVTLDMVVARAPLTFREWLLDRKNRRRIGHRMDECGYANVPNQAAKDGLWKIQGKRQTVYGRQDLALRDQLAAAETLTTAPQVPPLPLG